MFLSVCVKLYKCGHLQYIGICNKTESANILGTEIGHICAGQNLLAMLEVLEVLMTFVTQDTLVAPETCLSC